MINLILCLTLLNIGIESRSTRIFNIKLEQIENIMNNDASGDFMEGKVVMPCKVYDGELMNYAADCMNENLNTIMNHYKLRRELELIDRVERKNK